MAGVQLLEETEECTFDLSLDGPRLRPVFFGSRSNQPFEIHYHSFVGEVACGRWVISCCRRYLWGEGLLDLRLYRSEENLGVYWEYPPTPPLVIGAFRIQVRDHSSCCQYDERCRWFESSY